MVHIGDTEKRYDEKVIHQLLPILEEGDIVTHLFTANPGGVIDSQASWRRKLLRPGNGASGWTPPTAA